LKTRSTIPADARLTPRECGPCCRCDEKRKEKNGRKSPLEFGKMLIVEIK